MTSSTQGGVRAAWLARVGLAGLLTLAGFGLAAVARRLAGLPPPAGADLTALAFDAYIFGFAAQVTLAPVALIYLLSGTQAFKRLAGGAAAPGDRKRVFWALALIQFLALQYDWGLTILTGEQITPGLVTVVAGAWLGGWRMGLGLGLETALIRGTQIAIDFPNEQLAAALASHQPAALLDGGMWRAVFVSSYG
ncbi:MAG TPA: hypothetical protein VGE07_03120, partial [Herpetosiphonaceae bacterium]